MFNPKKPYNDLPMLPVDSKFWDTPSILKAVIRAKKQLSKLDWLLHSLPNKEVLLKQFALIESVWSSLIENIDTSIETAFEAVYNNSFDPSSMSSEEKETLHYANALMKGYDFIRNRKFLSLNWIFDIWSEINPNSWRLRNIPNRIEKSNFLWLKETIYTPPSGMNSEWKDALDALLNNFERYFNNEDDTPTLIKAIMLHYQFEAIHPFLDGNGRTGRVLIILHLILHKELCYPALFLSNYINSNKATYYELLLNVTKKGKRSDFILFMLKWIEDQSKKTIDKIEKMMFFHNNLIKSVDKIMKEMRWDYRDVLIDLFSHNAYISLDEIRKKTWVSINTWTRLFKLLVENWIGKDEVWKRLVKRMKNEKLLKVFNS